jgi:hypothetical protein
MAQYPIQSKDANGIIDALNYVLSGPAGLGQNYNGVSSSDPVYIRGAFRAPFTIPLSTTLNPILYLDWAITNITLVGSNPTDQIQVTFTPGVPQPNPPFQFGDTLTISGVTPTNYNGGWIVFSSTTTTVNLYRANKATYPAYVSGGNLIRDWSNTPLGTDCLATATVSGATDQPFVSAQLALSWNYTQLGGASDSWYDIVVAITRSRGTSSNAPGNINGFVYQFQDIISRQTDQLTAAGATVQNPVTQRNNFIFSNIFDGPNLPPGIYLYALQIGFITKPTLLISGPNTRVGALITNKFIASGSMTGLSAGTYAGITPQFISPIRAPRTSIPVANRATVTVTLTPDVTLPSYIIGQTVNVTVTTPGGPTSTTGVNDQVDGYKPGDILLIPGTALGGASPANDLTLQVTQTQYPGDIKPYIFGEGIRSLACQVIKA